MKTEKKQYLVKLQSKLEGDNFISFLKQNGYKNLHNICFDDLKIKVVAIDKNSFWSVGVTSLACAANCGKTCITVDEFFNAVEFKNTEVGLN